MRNPKGQQLAASHDPRPTDDGRRTTNDERRPTRDAAPPHKQKAPRGGAENFAHLCTKPLAHGCAVGLGSRWPIRNVYVQMPRMWVRLETAEPGADRLGGLHTTEHQDKCNKGSNELHLTLPPSSTRRGTAVLPKRDSARFVPIDGVFNSFWLGCNQGLTSSPRSPWLRGSSPRRFPPGSRAVCTRPC